MGEPANLHPANKEDLLKTDLNFDSFLFVNKMQNNSRNKASKRGRGGAAVKNTRAISGFMEKIRSHDIAENVHVGRVVKKLGNGQVEVLYSVKKRDIIKDNDGEVLEDKDNYELRTVQAKIRGTFRGRSKRSVWIEPNSPVLIEDSGLGIIEITALLTREQLKDMKKEMFIHPEILKEQGGTGEGDHAVEFANDTDEDSSDQNIDDI
jgi:hypothetical protein